MGEIRNDPVNHPGHYTTGKIECIDFITDKGLNFCRGNAVKYIVRAGLKDPEKEIEDLEKAVFYIRREIEDLRKAKEEAGKATAELEAAARKEREEKEEAVRRWAESGEYVPPDMAPDRTPGRLWMVDMATGLCDDGR